MGAPMCPAGSRCILFRGSVIELRKNAEGFWADKLGTLFALPDYSRSHDDVVRCGVGFFSLPDNHPLTAACGPHDYAYSSPVFQEFYTREEADAYLRELVLQVYPDWRGDLIGPAFEELAQQFGEGMWENEKTRG